ncbi:MAG: phosphorylase, partial [Sphingomonas sp.]|nr:phosphorylase [Sphingomonas sp.]
PFAFARTISDRADESLPPAAQVGMRPDGKVALGRVLASLAARPGQLPELLRTAKSAGAAFKALERVAAAVAALEQKQ